MGLMPPPKNDYEALVLALTLALTAADDDKAHECARTAQQIAGRLTAKQVADAQVEALAAAELWESGQQLGQ